MLAPTRIPSTPVASTRRANAKSYAVTIAILRRAILKPVNSGTVMRGMKEVGSRSAEGRRCGASGIVTGGLKTDNGSRYTVGGNLLE
jgi:hypothetical protein